MEEGQLLVSGPSKVSHVTPSGSARQGLDGTALAEEVEEVEVLDVDSVVVVTVVDASEELDEVDMLEELDDVVVLEELSEVVEETTTEEDAEVEDTLDTLELDGIPLQRPNSGWQPKTHQHLCRNRFQKQCPHPCHSRRL